ncbi:MAG: hypothetical protein A2341_13970 [Deltaproteobacteria bacterium RIFOXYB12_FULL_58_9]|nr:MAG: hypothetical protein A2341_13970 [Deltaproteobacteria bacterium RIFOXYB12_FULL_58_9]
MAERDDMRDEYDFTGGERAKYARRFSEGSNVVVLEPDVAKRFRTADEVNKALRKLMDAEKRSA